MARLENRFSVDIVIFLLHLMLFGHSEQSELKLIRLSYIYFNHSIDRTEYLLVALQRALL